MNKLCFISPERLVKHPMKAVGLSAKLSALSANALKPVQTESFFVNFGQ